MFTINRIFDSNFEIFAKKLMQNMIRTYCLYIRSINFKTINIEKIYFNRQINVLSIVATITNEIKNNKNIMFHFYMKYKEFESKNKTYELFKHTISNHVIDFIENKQSFYDLFIFYRKTSLKFFVITLSNI